MQPRLDGSVIVVIDERRNPLCKLRCRYPGYFIVKRVTNAGTFRFKKRLLFIANALIHHPIGLEKSRTACGRSSSVTSCSDAWTNGTMCYADCGRPGRTEDAAKNAVSSVLPGRG